MENFNILKGKIFNKIIVDDNQIFFYCDDNIVYKLYDANNSGSELESIVGDLEDLINNPILSAEEIKNEDSKFNCMIWTFYKLATIKGYVDIRWQGSNDGLYADEVSLIKVNNKKV